MQYTFYNFIKKFSFKLTLQMIDIW